jgi:tripartite-type tricarboxylate transporter receptor subunit TctC
VFHVLLVKKGIPRPVIEKLRKAFEDGITGGVWAEKLEKTLYMPIYFSPEETAKIFGEKQEYIKKTLNKIGLLD